MDALLTSTESSNIRLKILKIYLKLLIQLFDELKDIDAILLNKILCQIYVRSKLRCEKIFTWCEHQKLKMKTLQKLVPPNKRPPVLPYKKRLFRVPSADSSLPFKKRRNLYNLPNEEMREYNDLIKCF